VQPLIPAATKKRLFVMRSVEVRDNAYLLSYSFVLQAAQARQGMQGEMFRSNTEY
jgi:hypothetical protein